MEEDKARDCQCSGKLQVRGEHSRSVCCYLANVRSIVNKLSELEYILSQNKYDLLALTESFLKKDIADSVLLGNLKSMYVIYRCDRINRVGGGVALLCHSSLSTVRLNLTEHADFEIVAVDIYSKEKLRYVCVYRPPDCSLDSTAVLCAELRKLCNVPHATCLVGDFNLPLVDFITMNATGAVGILFRDFVLECSLTQFVSAPTRDQSLLDLVLCNDPLLISRAVVGPSFGTSDHSSISFNANLVKEVVNSQNIARYNFRKANIDLLRALLQGINWSIEFSCCAHVDDFYSVFINVLFKCISVSVPKCRAFMHSKKFPKYIYDLERKKLQLWRKRKLPGGQNKYRKFALRCTNAKRKFVQSREMSILNSRDLSKFYSYAKSKRVNQTGIAPLYDSNGVICVENQDKARILNDYFCSVFTEDDGRELPPFILENVRSKLSFINFTPQLVCKFLRLAPKKYSHSIEGFPSALLSLLSNELCVPLCTIFRVSLATGNLPKTWKMADVVPVLKKGDASDSCNYRPISLTSPVCKVFERILAENLLGHLTYNDLLYKNQFGFLPMRSTVSQLLTCVHDWVSALDKGLSTDIIYVDFAKAFDSVSHRKLLYKLHAYGIRGYVKDWISEFLIGRVQRVKVSDIFSEYCVVKSGIGQGTVLGPILFLLYINDVAANCPNNISVRLFADDTKIDFSFKKPEQCVQLRDFLKVFTDWCSTWQLKISEGKCGALHIGNILSDVYSLNDISLPFSASCKDLGVTVDDKLYFREHILTICKKGYAAVNMMFRIFSTNNLQALLLGYKSFVRPVLEYASNLWNPHINSPPFLGLVDQLESVQRYFTRRLFARCNLTESSYCERLCILKLSSLQERRIISDLCTMYKIIRGLINVPSNYFFQRNQDSRTRGNSYKLSINYCRLNVTKNSFANRMVNIWNALPDYVVTASSIAQFKFRLNSVNLVHYCNFDRNL